MIRKFAIEGSKQIFVAAFLAAITSVAGAQGAMDPSSALLLNSSNAESATRSRSPESRADSRLDSGRYTVRPRSEVRPENRTEPRPTATPAVKRPVEASSTTAPSTSPKSSEAEDGTPVVLVPTSDGVVVVSEPAKPDSSEENKVLKNRLLEVSIATAYLYENAESGYSFRQNTMAGPAYAAAAKVWFSPEFAIGGSYFSSLGGQVSDGASAVSASRTDTVFGVYIKKIFSQSDLTFGIELLETQFKISGDTVSKVNTKSNGVRVSIEGEFESGPSSSWVVGFSASPKIQHEESPAATNAQSGTAVNAYQVGASIERRWQFDATHAVFLKLEHRVERDLFTGSATQADPIGGATPTGVAATVGTTVIQFGYNWGN